MSRGDRNASWAAATPVGNLEMSIQNPAAVQWWRDFLDAANATGRQLELFLDLYPSEDGWPGDGHTFRLADVPETHYLSGKCGQCGMGKDDDYTEYDPTIGKSVGVGKVHPNG